MVSGRDVTIRQFFVYCILHSRAHSTLMYCNMEAKLTNKWPLLPNFNNPLPYYWKAHKINEQVQCKARTTTGRYTRRFIGN